MNALLLSHNMALEASLTEKAFDKVWHSVPIKPGVPQGSVQGPFIYILFTYGFPTSPPLAQIADEIITLLKTSSSQLAALHIQNFVRLVCQLAFLRKPHKIKTSTINILRKP